jgi:general secretion pathway protein G
VRHRPGFTLIEIMVALIILSGLIAIMIPVVMGQATRGEPTRAAADLSAVSSALSLFRAHTLTLPDDLEDLVNPIDAADRQIDGSPYSPSMISRWRGPYLDVPMGLAGAGDPFSADSLATGFRAFIAPVLTLYDGLTNDSLPLTAIADANYVAVMVRGLDASEFQALNDLIDGPGQEPGFPGCTQCSWDRGRLRYDGGSGVTYYLAAPYRHTP